MADLKPRNAHKNTSQSTGRSTSRQASRQTGQEKKTKDKKRNLFQQIKMIYTFTKKEDPSITWWMLGGFLIPALLVLALGFVLRNGWLGWILNVITALLLGFLVMTIILTNRSETAGYRRLEGQPGATGAVLDSLSSGKLTGKVVQFTKEPVWIDPRTKNAIWRGTSLYGVFLVAEGPKDAMDRAMDKEVRKVHRVTQGSDIPIYRICVGNGKGQVPLSKLRKELRKRHKIKFTMDELDHVNDRLRTLQGTSGLPIPKGIDPMRMKKVSRRAMRGR